MPQTMKLLALPLTLLCANCAYTVTGQSARCSELIPAHWADGVEGVEVPATDELRDWQKGFVGQSVQLEKANARQADTVAIFSGCERLLNETRPRKKVLGIF